MSYSFWLLGVLQQPKTRGCIKSENLNETLGRWVDGTIVSSTKHLMFQLYIIFFHNFLQNSLQKPLDLFFYYFLIEIKSFEFPKSKPMFYFQSIKIILGPSDAWSMRRLTQWPSVSYRRLLDFRVHTIIVCEFENCSDLSLFE